MSVVNRNTRVLCAAILLVHGCTANCVKFFDLWQWIAAPRNFGFVSELGNWLMPKFVDVVAVLLSDPGYAFGR